VDNTRTEVGAKEERRVIFPNGDISPEPST